MPGPQGRGRIIPSQAGDWQSLGVCNEHGLPPKGMMCSGLHGNMQRPAEMIGPLDDNMSFMDIYNVKP